jgi:hypothetical protein
VALLFAAGFTSACSTGEQAGDDPLAGSERQAILAPIEAAEVVVRESFPPQYAVRVTSRLPSGRSVTVSLRTGTPPGRVDPRVGRHDRVARGVDE